jgi:hypothetical protein
MHYYVFLAGATLFGFFGLGSVSIAFLLVLWIVSLKPEPNSVQEAHRRWARRSGEIALAVHAALTAFLIYKVNMVAANNGHGWFAAVVSHWFLDHLGEALVSVWLAYRTLKGGVNCQQKRMPEFTGLNVLDSSAERIESPDS